MQPCKTGDQLYSDASPDGECSLAVASSGTVVAYSPNGQSIVELGAQAHDNCEIHPKKIKLSLGRAKTFKN